MSGLPIKVRSVLGCDDIREEASGKYSAIGIFGPDLTLVPDRTDALADRMFRATFLLTVDVLATGEHELEFRLRRSKGGGGIARMTVELDGRQENVPFPVGPMTLRVPSDERELSFAIKDGETWRRLARWSIEVGDSPPSA